MTTKTLVLRAALAASIAGCVGFTLLSSASAATIALGGPGSDLGSLSPYSDSVPADTAPSGAADAWADPSPDAASGQSSMLSGGDPAQNVAFAGTMGDAATVTDPAPAKGAGVAATFDPRVSLPDGIGPVSSPDVDFTAMTALATPKAAMTVTLFGFAILGFVAYRRSRKASVAIAA